MTFSVVGLVAFFRDLYDTDSYKDGLDKGQKCPLSSMDQQKQKILRRGGKNT